MERVLRNKLWDKLDSNIQRSADIFEFKDKLRKVDMTELLSAMNNAQLKNSL